MYGPDYNEGERKSFPTTLKNIRMRIELVTKKSERNSEVRMRNKAPSLSGFLYPVLEASRYSSAQYSQVHTYEPGTGYNKRKREGEFRLCCPCSGDGTRSKGLERGKRNSTSMPGDIDLAEVHNSMWREYKLSYDKY